MFYKKVLVTILTLIALSSLTFFSGCDTTENVNGNLSLSFSSSSGLNKITADSLSLETVKILLRDVKLKSESDDNDDDTPNGDSTGNHENEKECSIKVGPFVVHLNLNGMTTDFAIANVLPGTYDRIKFKIHKVEGSEIPPDPEFKEGDDESLRYSVIVKGTFNSTPFVYKSRKSAHQDLRLETPLVVEANTLTNLTITVDPYSWFYENGNVLDPTNPANENDIDNNIKDSFKRCYKDDDHNGDDD